MKFLSVLFLAFVVVGCGSDEVEPGGVPGECPVGTRWNPISGQCEGIGGGNNATNNNSANNTSGNNANNVANNTQNNQNNSNPNNQNNQNNANNNNLDMGNGPDLPVEVCMDGFGSLVGKACAPSGEPLAAADVKITGVDCDGMPFELTVRTGSDGVYRFEEVPHGTHDVEITVGSFTTDFQARVVAGRETDLLTGSEKVCLDQNVEIAVIEGAYDHVEGLLTQLNLQYTVVGSDGAQSAAAVDFLTDLNAMMQYDIVFLNCGQYFTGLSAFDFQRSQIGATLRQYVQSGRSVYVSDWAHPFVEAAFPEMIDWYGEEDNIRDARKGYAPQTIEATVSSVVLESVLGSTEAQIEFPNDPLNMIVNNNWAVPVGVGPNAVMHLTGDAALCGNATLLNQCPQSGSQPAVPLLVTYKDPSGGSVVFTSFHNERQVTLNQDMERILRFLIFSL